LQIIYKMTMKKVAEENFSLLLRCMNPSPDLLGRLRSVIFLKDQITFINQQLTDNLKNNALLNVLIEVPDDVQETVVNGFISALRSSGQEHVANIFRRESDKFPMSYEHYKTLTDNIDQLCRFIDPENGLLDKLVSTEVISLTDAQSIRSTSCYNEMARKLIETITWKSDDAFHGLVNALNHTGQSHVTYLLTGEGKSRPLKEEHRRKLLTTKREYLVNTIDSKCSGFVTALMSKDVFSDYDEQRVTGVQPNTSYDLNEIILNLIARKSQSDFLNFISALTDTDQTHVVLKLIGVNIVAKIKTIYESGLDVGHIPDVDAELLEYMREMFQSNGDVVKRLNELLSSNGVAVSDVREGCIEVTFTCESFESLHNFRELYNSWMLEQMLNKAFRCKFANKGLTLLKVAISNEQFEQCAGMFCRWSPMTCVHRGILLSPEKWLLGKVTVSGYMLDKLPLCRRRKEAIERTETHEQQVKTLVDIVSRRPDSAFTQFLNALNDTNQHVVADIISGDKSKKRVLHERYTEDPWEHAAGEFGHLLHLIGKVNSNYLDEYIIIVSK